MIEVMSISKSFGDIKAITDISTTIREGSVFGLVGTNGAGKSTFMRILSGILKADKGSVKIDNMEVFENIQAKKLICFIPDTPYYFNNATVKEMMEYYKIIYPEFSEFRFIELVEKFGLDMKRKINTFSKGMKKQVSVLLGICTNTKYLLCDETFDGLDPVMRQAVKSIFASEILNREFTPIIASHNLRELEDICDHVGLLHEGGILLSRDLEDMRFEIHKLQYVIQNPTAEEEILKELDVMQYEKRGSLVSLTVRGKKETILALVGSKKPLFYEILPLSLEEIFICETEVAGYDIKNLIL